MANCENSLQIADNHGEGLLVKLSSRIEGLDHKGLQIL